MARKWQRLLLVLGLVSVWIRCSESNTGDEESSLTLESWVAAIRAPPPAPRTQKTSSLNHKISEGSSIEDTRTEIEDRSETGEISKDGASTHNKGEQDEQEDGTLNTTKDDKDRDVNSRDEADLENGKTSEIEAESKSANEAQSVKENDEVINDNNEKQVSVSNAAGGGTVHSDVHNVDKLAKTEKTQNKIPKPAEEFTDTHQETKLVSENPREGEFTSSSSTSVATARMLLVNDDSTSPLNSSSISNRFSWRLTDTNILKDIANKISLNEEAEVINPNRSGELAEHPVNNKEAASKVVETRVLPPGQFRNHSRKNTCRSQNSWACLSPKERIQLRQKLLKDLQTSYNAPLTSRIRYRLKKKPSVYTSKKPNSRFDIGIPDIYETEVHVTPKYNNHIREPRPTVGYPESDYRVAADRSHHQYLPTPAGPSYVPIGALITPAYPNLSIGTVTKPYIPLNRNYEGEQSSGLVFRPPRRPPGSTRRRTDGLLHRPTQGKPHFFTPTPDRVSLQAHLQYRRPVSFKYKRTGIEVDHHDDAYTDPTTRVYTTEPYPVITSVTPYSVVTMKTSHHELPTKGYTKPPEKYLPPSKEYATPHQDPSPTYKPPATAHSELPQKYLPPNKEYVAPHHSHPTTIAGYTELPQKYIPPSKEYIAPHTDSQPSVKPHSIPTDNYLPPSKEYIAPETSHKPTPKPYTDPPRNYLPPDKGYLPPQTVSEPPAPIYSYPPSEYVAPKSPHQQPSAEHKPTVKDYADPPRKYLPPNKEYGVPSLGPKQAEVGHPSPPRKYLPPDKPYSSPHRVPGNGPPHRRRRPGKRRRKHRKRPTPPSRTYLPPHKQSDTTVHDKAPGYGPPTAVHGNKASSGYEAPERKYQPPSKEYLPPVPVENADPHPGTTVASVFYTAPARTYLPPVENYNASPQAYATPSPAYGTPSKDYISHPEKDDVLPHHLAPTPEYVPPLPPTPPAKLYGTPKPTYEAPSLKYELPIRDYVIAPPKPEPHDTALPSWLMSLQGKPPTAIEEIPKYYTTNPTPPPGYHPKHSTREEYYPSTESTPEPEYHAPKPTYAPPKPGYHAPEPTYLPPKKDHHAPALTYLPPKHEYSVPEHIHSSPKPGYHAPEPTYAPPKPGYHAPEPTYLPPKPKPGYHAPEPTYGPPKLDHHIPELQYIPPKPGYPSPAHNVSPMPSYQAPEPTYAPPKPGYHAPEHTYSPPKPGYHAPEPTYISPKKDPHAPELTYLPPQHEYHIPEHLHSSKRPGYHAPEPTYAPPKPELTYGTPKPGYHAPEPTYLPPKAAHKPGYHAPEPTYKPPEHEHYAPEKLYEPPKPDYHPEPGYHAPKPTYKPPVHPVTIVSPNYAPPIRTYLPPVKEYLPPKEDPHPAIPGYVPPKPPMEDYAPQMDVYVPPKSPPIHDYMVSTPKTSYIPPPPPLHVPIDLHYLPPPREPTSNYLPPQQAYLPPASYDTHSTPHPPDSHVTLSAPISPHSTPAHAISPAIHLEPNYVPPTHPEPEYLPPVTSKPHMAYISSLKPDYVAPIPSKEDYVAPAPPKQEYITPSKAPETYHVTTYKPNYNSELKMLQDFSYPGTGKVSHPTRLPHQVINTTMITYSPPVYTPATYGPGYNDAPTSARPALHPSSHPLAISDYDDYYYYYDDDDDYYYDYYYDDDDDDYYYYYYDDYDYGLPQRRPVPHHLIPNIDYDVLNNEIYDFGYIAGIPGRAGRDYPILSYIPLTSFGCDLVADYPGYYADMEAGCQVFHICHRSGRQDSFLCPNGTIFNQKYFVCDWWYNFACEDAPFFYPVNAAIGHPGVPLHRNAFEPNLQAVRHLPPRDPYHPYQHQVLNHATPVPVHYTTPVPHHLTASPHAFT